MQHAAGDLTSLFPPDKVVPRDRLLSWETMTPQQIREEFRSYFNPFWAIAPLTQRQVDVLRAIIHPEIVIKAAPAGEDLAVLDMRQERNARTIGAGHRILYGVAGSGKTVLLISRAKFLARENPTSQILVLCFNVALAAHLRGALTGHPNVSVHHFDGWSKTCGITRRGVKDDVETNAALGNRLKAQLQSGMGDSRRYDAVLIDEAQDFDGSWFACVLEAMKDPNDGDLLIVGDRQQGIVGPQTIRWSQVGISAQGRTISRKLDLDKNYRNSREILELAACFALDQTESDDEDQFGVIPVDPAKSLRSTGIRPFLVSSRDRAEECDKAVEIVKRLLQHNGSVDARFSHKLEPSQIGILYPSRPWREKALFDAFLQKLESLAPVVWINQDKGANRDKVAAPGIKVQTIHSSKGLQYRAVILLWADVLPRQFPDSDPSEEAKLAYVALTRPEDYLFISHSGHSEFIHRMVSSGLTTSL
jgi:superfamily I DNA/RNA helicase